MQRTEISGVEFDLHTGPVGIAFSGGADSTILLYILLRYISGPIHIFTCSSRDRGWVQPQHASKVINYLLDVSGRNDVYHHTHFVPTKNKSTIFSHMMSEKYGCDIIYTAGTCFPSSKDLEEFDVDKNLDPTWLYEIRDPKIVRPLYNPPFYSPWWNQNKKFIAGVYKDFGQLETLFPLTRSCENGRVLSGHCGRCWFCQERKWAFGRLD